MRSLSSLRPIFLVGLLVSGLACGDDGGQCMPVQASGQPMRDFEVGEYDGDTFAPYEDGSTQTFVRGLQGGYMVVPTIRIPAETDAAPCVTLVIENAIDSAGDALPSLTRVMTWSRRGDFFETPPLENFLSFEQSTLIDQELRMRVRVISDAFQGERVVRVMLAPPM